MAEIIRAPIQAQMDQVYPKNLVQTTQDRPSPTGLRQGGPGQPAGRSWGRLAHLAGRPTYRSADLAHGPHRLILDMWRLPVGCLSWFQVLQPVAPSYKYKGRGVEEWTHTHHTLSTHLSPLELEAFILDA